MITRALVSTLRKIDTHFPPSIDRFAATNTLTSNHSNNARHYSKVGIAGLGLMGHGICQVTAQSPSTKSVIAYEPSDVFLTRGRDRIEKSLHKLVAKDKITSNQAEDTLGKITFTTEVEELRDVDLLVEAIIENISLKNDFYKRVGDVCDPSTVFASNTSSLSVTEMGELSGRPDRFVGLHFFNPVQVMKLVEVIKTKETLPVVFDGVYNWVGSIGKAAVSCGDTPGFIVNRLLVPSIAQGMLMVDRGEASVKDIDVGMRLGAAYPMGLLHLADYVGLDTCYFILDGWTEKYPNEPAFVMPECLKAKFEAGELGRKTGKGFYYWDGDKRGDPVE